MSRKKGTVTKAGKGKFSYFLQLDGNDYYYNTKFEPKCGEGDVVGITFTSKGDSRGQISDVKIIEDNSGGYKKANSEFKEDASGGGKPAGGKSYGDRNESIVFQSSRKDALVLVGLLVKAEAIKLPAKADAKRVIIEELLDEITVKYYQAAIDPTKSSVLAGALEAASNDKEDGDWPDDDSGGEPDDTWDD